MNNVMGKKREQLETVRMIHVKNSIERRGAVGRITTMLFVYLTHLSIIKLLCQVKGTQQILHGSLHNIIV